MPPRRSRSATIAFAALWAFATAVIAGHFWARHTLDGDNLVDYSFFYNNLQSLNRFGEPAWWHPNTNMGHPGYFFSIVSIISLGMPASVAMGALAWLLGRLGITLTSFHGLYVFYFGALVPLLFLLGVALIARQLFASRLVRGYVLIVAAFSPGVMMNQTDIGGLEHTTYGLYFAAALLRFLRRPTSARSYFWLAVTVGLLGLSFNYLFLVTVAPLLAALAALLAAYRVFRRRLGRVLRAQPAWRWAALVLVAALGVVPNVIAFAQRGDLQREEAGLTYSFAAIKTGNPWEALLASTPAIGFECDHYYAPDESRPTRFLPHGIFNTQLHVSYGYLGLLAVPLAAWGLLFGRAPLRHGLLAAAVLVFGIILLGGYSPLLAAVLVWPSPLQGMNHYSDMTFRDMGFLVLLLAAGLGLERIERNGPGRFPLLFAVSALLSIAVTARLHGLELSTATGTTALLALALFALLMQSPRAAGSGRTAGLLLLAVTLADVSTMAFWHVRMLPMKRAWVVNDAPYADGLGIAMPRANRGASRLLHFRQMLHLTKAGLPYGELPFLSLHGAAHIYDHQPDARDFSLALGRGPRSLALAPPDDPALRTPLEGLLRRPTVVTGGAELDKKTFNTIDVRVDAGGAGLLLVRDAFSPYWRAWVNGRRAPVYRALGGFKAVPVPEGVSQVRLRFSPPWLALSLALAYGLVSILAVAAWRARG